MDTIRALLNVLQDLLEEYLQAEQATWPAACRQAHIHGTLSILISVHSKTTPFLDPDQSMPNGCC